MKRKKKKSGKRIAVFMIAEMIATLISVVILISLSRTTYSADHTAEKHVKAILTQDWSALYDTLLIEDTNEFLSKEAYVTAQTINCTDLKYNDVDVKKVVKKENQVDDKKYTVEYTADGKNGSMEVETVKKGLTWKVKADVKICKQFILSVPKGADVTLDGISLSSKYKKSKNNSTRDVYHIPKVYGETHYIGISGEDFEETNQLVTMEEEGKIIRVQADYNQELLQAIARRAADDLNTILSGAAGEKNYISLPVLKNMYQEHQKEVIETYAKIKKDVFQNEDEDLKMVDCRMENYSVKVKPDTKQNDNYLIVSIGGECVMRFFNERRDNELEEVTGEASSELTYRKHNGEWKLYDFSINLPEVEINTYWEEETYDSEESDTYEETDNTDNLEEESNEEDDENGL